MILQLLAAVNLIFSVSKDGPATVTGDHKLKSCSDWKLDRYSEGVKTYSRWIELEGSDKVRERKGETVINCSVEDVVKILCDSKSTELWMTGIKENYCLKTISPSEWYAYTLFDIPWPFEKRDLISDYSLDYREDGKTVIIRIKSREDFMPEKLHITRLTKYTATWIISRTATDRATVTFTAIANTRPIFPRFVQDPILVQLFHNNLVNLKKMLDS